MFPLQRCPPCHPDALQDSSRKLERTPSPNLNPYHWSYPDLWPCSKGWGQCYRCVWMNILVHTWAGLCLFLEAWLVYQCLWGVLSINTIIKREGSSVSWQFQELPGAFELFANRVLRSFPEWWTISPPFRRTPRVLTSFQDVLFFRTRNKLLYIRKCVLAERMLA